MLLGECTFIHADKLIDIWSEKKRKKKRNGSNIWGSPIIIKQENGYQLLVI